MIPPYKELAKEAVFYSLESGDYHGNIESFGNYFSDKYGFHFDKELFFSACDNELFGEDGIVVFTKELENE